MVQGRRREFANLRVEERRQGGRGAAQEQVAEGRAQVFFDGQLHRLGAQA